MNKRTRDAFYSLWTLAIFLCIGISLFVMLFASCVKAGDTAAESDSNATEDTTATETPAPTQTPVVVLELIEEDAEDGEEADSDTMTETEEDE